MTWTGGFVLEGPSATLTSNTGSNRYTLFSASSKVDAVTGFHARVGVHLTRSLVAEAGFLFSQPSASTQLSGDVEGAAPTTAEETMTSYVFDGGVAYHLRGLSFAGGKGVPFVSGSVGYLRELHEGNTLIETGTQYHLGVGLTMWLGSGRFGIRGEGGVAIRDTGDDSSTGRRSLPTAGLSATYRF